MADQRALGPDRLAAGRADAVADRIDELVEEIADLAMALLGDALEGDVDAREQEKVVTRARRSLEKASALLRTGGSGLAGGWD